MKRLVSMILVLLMLCVPVLSMADTDVNAELAAAASALIDLGKTEEAQEILDRMGKGNTASACISLGVRYFEGAFSDGTPDYAGAKQWWQTARELGSDSGTYNLALLCWKGFQDESNVPDYEQAFALFMEIVDSEDEATSGKALTQLGIGYFKGYFTEDGEPDYVKAQEYLLQGYEKGRSLAAEYLGEIAVGGLVTGEPDYEAAYQYHLFAAEDGRSYSAHEIADGYLDGNFNGGVIDVEKALEWYIKADELGSTCAYRHIWDIYHKGVTDAEGNVLYTRNVDAEQTFLADQWERGTENTTYLEWYTYYLNVNDSADVALVVEVAKKGADLGSTYCTERLAKLYCSGIKSEDGTMLLEKDYAAALPYLERLVEAGADDTYFYEYLGWIYAGNTDACEADYEKAMQVYTAGADLGSKYCMHQIGLIYVNGDLGEVDAEKAVDWLTRATKGEDGHADALDDLERAQSLLKAE